MKIRAIHLSNVRRFAGCKASISGIADGLTTICEPNETGKSTFFDALHALLFLDHKSSAAEIRSLQPYSKGSVEIAAEIETEHGSFRVEKRYLASRGATVSDSATGRIIAQEGEAEAWIAEALGGDMAGPAGLLWVRQGVSGFDPDGTGPGEKRIREKTRDARRSLMSSVAGQIDSVTGGQRMDAIMTALEADLDALATKTLAPKAGGEWGKAVRQAETLEAERVTLKQQVDALADALRERARLTFKRDDPHAQEAERLRAVAIEEGLDKLNEARSHAGEVDTLRREIALAELEAKSVSDQLAARKTRAEQRMRLEGETLAAGELVRTRDVDAKEAEARFAAVALEGEAARQRLDHARRAEAQSQRQRDRDAAQRRAGEIEEVLARVAGFEDALRDAKKLELSAPMTATVLGDLQKLSQQLATATAKRDAGATNIAVAYSGAARIGLPDGSSLEGDVEMPVHGVIRLELPGIGSLRVAPPKDASAIGDSPERLAALLKARLAECGLDDLAAAHASFDTAQGARAALETAQASLDALVPHGTDTLRRELAELKFAAGRSPGEPRIEAELSIVEAEKAEQLLRSTLESARRDRDAAAASQVEARTAHRFAEAALRDIANETGPTLDPAELHAALAAAQDRLAVLVDDHARLAEAAPDIETLEADQARLMSARENALQDSTRTQARIHELDGLIGARAGDGVESRLDEVSGALEHARSRAARYAFEVRALDRLRGALNTARRAARDAYFEPIKQELLPLIAMLHADVDIEMDSETMLPQKLRRGDVEDDITGLSSGAAEQIAILTRLAFARLYARQGRSVPVILDDALVFSDDERIVRMFTALTRIAKDQQIIVFSCRSRAFGDLGGYRPSIEIER